MLLLEQFYNLTLNPANAALLKELVLQLAVHGKLTETWRKENPDVEPAFELLKRIEAEKEQLVNGKKILTSVKENEIPFDLPDSWGWYRLGEIGYCQTGTTPSKTNSAFSGDYIPFIGPADISSKGINYLGEGLSKEGLERGRFIPKNSVMMVCIGGSIGKVNVNTRDVSCNQQINTITPLLSSALFVYYFLSSPFFQKAVFEKSTGSATPIINKGKWETIPFALPPLAEQEAIVARVEELFKNIEALQEKTAKRIELKKKLGNASLQNLIAATAEKLPQNWQFLKDNFGTIFSEVASVKKLRETILQFAVQGILTQTWRHQNPNHEPASELLKRIMAENVQLAKKKIRIEQPLGPVPLNEVPFDLPESWAWCRLGNISNLITSGSRDWAKYYSSEGAKFIRMGNLSKNNFILRLNNMQYVLPSKNSEGNRTRLVENDILLSITGEVGMLGLIPKNFGEAYINQHTALIRLNKLLVNRYFAYTLLSRPLQNQFNEPQRGIKNSFRLSDIDNLIVPLPPLTEQEAIVAKVDELMQLCEELKKQIEHANQKNEALMHAMVQEALQVNEEEVKV